MPKTFLKKSTGWTEIKSIFVKKTTGWTEVKNVFLKKSTGWVKVFTKLSLPDTTTSPSIRTTNTGSGTIYDGPVATSPQYLNEDLFGKDGVYTNYTSIFGRKFTRGSTSSATSRTTIVNSDLFTSGGGVTTAMRQACDDQYLFYELTVQNGSAANEIYPISSAIKMIKSQPFSNTFTVTGSTTIGTTLTANIDIEYYYYNRPELASSYVRWYVGTYAGDTTGTPVKTTSLSTAQTSTSSSAYLGSDTLLIDSSYSGKYITVTLDVESSWTRNEGYATSSYQLDFAYAGSGTAVTGALTFSNISVKDYFGVNSGLDNRGRWPTGTLNRFVGQVNNYDTSTVVRIRYRIYNFDTGLYWNPATLTQTTASNAWVSYTNDGTGSDGYISSFGVNGTTATFDDYFDLDINTFNGGGSGPTWWLEIELSALKLGGTRVYYVNPYETYYISKRIDSSVSVSSSTVSLNTNVTVSGGFVGYPATPSTNAYPKQYKVDYGDNTDSGWLPIGEYSSGTLNPTYSLTKQYTTAGTYTIRTRTIPYGTDATTTITASSGPTTPTSLTATNNNGAIRLTFSGGTGDQYDIYYANSSTRPTDGQAFADYPNVTSPYDPPLTARNVQRWFWVRKSSGSLRSNWYPSDSSVSIRLPLLSPPPFTITNSAQTSSSLSWYWSQPTPSASQDEPTSWDWAITQSTSTPATWPNNVTTRPTSTSPLVTSGLTENTTYYLHVRAKNQDASTTAYQSGTTSSAKLSTPSGLFATTTRTDGIQISWSPVSGANYYGVWYRGSAPTYDTVPDFGGPNNPSLITGTSYLDTSVGSGTSRTYDVQAYKTGNPAGTKSEYGGPVTGTRASIQYSVTWDANGGSGGTTTGPFNAGSSHTAPSVSRSGYTLNGWYTASSGGSFVTSAGGSYTPTSTITVYAQWSVSFTPPSSGAVSWSSGTNFQRTTTLIRWFTDYPSISGDGSFTGMQFEIRTTAGGGTLLASGERSYPGAGTYPYAGGGTIWAFRCGTSDGDISYSSSARYARVRTVMLGTNGTTYYGSWTGWI